MPPVIALIIQLLSYAIGVAAVFCLIDVAMRPSQVFPAIDRQTKPFWFLILGLCLLIAVLFGAYGFFGLFASVGVVFYLVDVRPKAKEITRR